MKKTCCKLEKEKKKKEKKKREKLLIHSVVVDVLKYVIYKLVNFIFPSD